MKKKGMSSRNRHRMIFYLSIVTIPVIHFCIFYLGVNFNSILLAFQRYDMEMGKYVWAGFDNFRQIISDFKEVPYLSASIKNSLILYGVTILSMTLSTFFSYYIYKKRRFSGFYKIVLFLPHIISSIILVVMFKYFTERAIPHICELLTGKVTNGLLSNPKLVFLVLLFYSLWSSFGIQILIFSGSMEGINPTIIDAAKIDGVTPFQEFRHIVLPMIWPTISNFIVVGVAGIFTNQMHLFSFYGTNAEYRLYTFGYFLYRSIKVASLSDFPYLAAMGLFLTCIAVPLTLFARWLVNKLGPKVN